MPEDKRTIILHLSSSTTTTSFPEAWTRTLRFSNQTLPRFRSIFDVYAEIELRQSKPEIRRPKYSEAE